MSIRRRNDGLVIACVLGILLLVPAVAFAQSLGSVPPERPRYLGRVPGLDDGVSDSRIGTVDEELSRLAEVRLHVVLEQLDEQVSWRRLAAVVELARRQDPTTLPRIVSLANDPDKNLRGVVPRAIFAFPVEIAFPALTRLLASTDVELQREVISTLTFVAWEVMDPGSWTRDMRLPRPAPLRDAYPVREIIALLRPLMSSPNDKLREEAAHALSRIDRPDWEAMAKHRHFDSLLGFVEDDNPVKRSDALYWLAQVDGRRAAEIILRALRDRDSIVRARAVSVLASVLESGSFNELDSSLQALWTVAEDRSEAVQVNVAFALATLADRRAAPLLFRHLERLIATFDRDGQSQFYRDTSKTIWAIADLRVASSFDLLASFVVAAKTELPHLDFIAARAIGRVDPDRARSLAADLIVRGGPRDTSLAVEILDSTPDCSLVELLFRRFADRALRDWSSLDQATRSCHGSYDVAPLLERFDIAAAPNETVDGRIVGRLADEPGVRALIDRTRSPHPSARANAAWALGNSAHPDGIAVLIALLGDEDDDVVRWAIIALGKRQSPAAIYPLMRLLSEGRFENLARRADRELDDIRAMLVQRAPYIDELVLDSLDVWLANIENRPRQYRAVEKVAIGVLGDAGDPEALPVLQARSETDLLSNRARCQLGDSKATTKLMTDFHRAFSDPDSPFQRINALIALTRCRDPRIVALMKHVIHAGVNEIEERFAMKALQDIRTDEVLAFFRSFIPVEAGWMRDAAMASLTREMPEVDVRLLRIRFDRESVQPIDYYETGWLPSGAPISDVRIRHAANRLNLSQSEVRLRYENLAATFNLNLVWKN